MPEEVIARARRAGLRVIPTGLQHGTVTVLLPHQAMRGGVAMREDRPVEITTFRGDGPYRDGRHPESVQLGVSLEEDLARRDFTINAMALPIEFVDAPDWEARVVDPYGGKADLAAGLLRAVGDPLHPFRRGRPATPSGLPLCTIEPGTWFGNGAPIRKWPAFEVEPMTIAAIPSRLDVCAKVAVERVYIELTKLISGAEPKAGLQILSERAFWTSGCQNFAR
ncbi:MAG: hypothetical protein IPL96_06385 [Holophagaceae bacterium]|nr:hypothetical protein [Holophagaceae bacterium]